MPLTGPGPRGLMVLAAAGGALAAFGQAPWSLPYPALAGLALGLWTLILAPSARAGFLVGWSMGSGYFAVALHWIVQPFQVDAATYGWMAPFAAIFLAMGLGLFWGLAGAVTQALGHDRPALARGLLAALALTATEMLRSVVLTGFPWALIGHIWSASPQAQLAAWIGPHGLTLLTLLPLGLALGWLPRAPLRAAGVLLAATGAALGLGLSVPPAPAPGPDAPVLRLVQPNAPQREKWDPDRIPVFFARQLEFTAAPASPAPALVIWPETAIAWSLPYAEPAFARIAAAADGVPVVLGLNGTDGPSYTNTLVALDAAGAIAARYDKARLVPFGEYLPLGDLAADFGLSGFAARDGAGYKAGPGPHLLDLGAAGTALPLICYEAIFPGFGRTLSREADWMLQITNDAWFGNFAGPRQHLALARMRAIERGLPLVRVANTGISAVIDARGAITAGLALNEAGALDAPLPPRLPPTLYARTGDWPVLALLVALAALALTLGPRRRAAS